MKKSRLTESQMVAISEEGDSAPRRTVALARHKIRNKSASH